MIADETPEVSGGLLPRPAVNFFAGVGRLVGDAEFFPSQAGRSRIGFRIAIPRHPRLPRKKPACDFYSIVCYGERFIPLLDRLTMGREVVVVGWAQSRDVQGTRVVSEIGAEAVILLLDEPLLAAVERLVEAALEELDEATLAVLQQAVAGTALPNPLPDGLAPLFHDGQMHPEVRLAVERALARRGLGEADEG